MSLNIRNSRFIELPKIKDGRDGILCVAEQQKNISFDIKRVFYIYDLHDNNAVRGKHAHKNVEQVIFCIKGSLELLLDDGLYKETVKLEKPNVGLYLGTYVWNVMTKFSEDCILLVLASDFYNENEYIRDYNQFLAIALKQSE
ncbi:MAG: WxcM-like domain-containing protein [Bacteroidales bacterium]|nr:WxcM-like domain-containing protein [Bacteroidales bacterium]